MYQANQAWGKHHLYSFIWSCTEWNLRHKPVFVGVGTFIEKNMDHYLLGALFKENNTERKWIWQNKQNYFKNMKRKCPGKTKLKEHVQAKQNERTCRDKTKLKECVQAKKKWKKMSRQNKTERKCPCPVHVQVVVWCISYVENILVKKTTDFMLVNQNNCLAKKEVSYQIHDTV